MLVRLLCSFTDHSVDFLDATARYANANDATEDRLTHASTVRQRSSMITESVHHVTSWLSSRTHHGQQSVYCTVCRLNSPLQARKGARKTFLTIGSFFRASFLARCLAFSREIGGCGRDAGRAGGSGRSTTCPVEVLGGGTVIVAVAA